MRVQFGALLSEGFYLHLITKDPKDPNKPKEPKVEIKIPSSPPSTGEGGEGRSKPTSMGGEHV